MPREPLPASVVAAGVAVAGALGAFAIFLIPPTPPVAFGVAITALLLFPLAWGGLRLARGSLGLDPLPVVSWLTGTGHLRARSRLIPGVAVGVAAAFFLWSLLLFPLLAELVGEADTSFFDAMDGPELLAFNLVTLTEEIIFRLGVLFLVAGTWMRFVGGPRGAKWVGIGISALLFGLLHVLNAAVYNVDPARLLVVAILIQGVGGVALGWVAWRWGVEAAWLTHYAYNVFQFLLSTRLLGS